MLPINVVIDGLQQVIASGTEEQALAYIKDHFKEFPEDVQQRVVLAFYADALEEEVARRKIMLEIKQEVAALLKEFDKADAAEGK